MLIKINVLLTNELVELLIKDVLTDVVLLHSILYRLGIKNILNFSIFEGLDELNELTKNAKFELTERLCVYDKYINDEWLNKKLLKNIFKLS